VWELNQRCLTQLVACEEGHSDYKRPAITMPRSLLLETSVTCINSSRKVQ